MTSLVDRNRPSSMGIESTSIIWCIAVLSFSLLMLVDFLGSIGAYLFSGLWILVGLFTLSATFEALFFRWQVWTFATFALISAIWSPIPALTIRYSLELLVTIGAAVLAAHHLSPRKIITAISCSFFLVAVCAVVFGRWGYDYLGHSPVFLGVFATKNELAFFTNHMLLANLAIVGDSEHKLKTRFLNALFAIFSIYLLVVTRSATSWVLAILGPGVLFASFIVARATPSRRMLYFLSTFLCLIISLILSFGFLGESTSDLLGVLGKDTTLTGRTILWERALSLIPKNPFLGVGFGGFWQPNFVEAENIWRMFDISNPYGFHFHDTYLETTIELGIIGCCILIYLMCRTLINLVRWSRFDRSFVSSFYVATIFTLLLASFVEVEIIKEFYIGTVLFYICMYCGYEFGGKLGNLHPTKARFPPERNLVNSAQTSRTL
jgi:exopolysaccharide production protein ExoQ